MPAMFPDLKDTSVFITGGGSGIGAALTEGFMAQGSKVAFVQRTDAAAFCDQMERKHGSRPFFIPCDITEIPALKRAMDEAAEMNGPITVLVNNAANDQRHDTEKVTEEFWDWCQAVNLKAYFFACQHAIAGMRLAGGGSIVNFSSIAYMMGAAGFPGYAAANSGINGLTRSLAREFGPDGIRVNAIAPGWVLTKRQKDLWATPEKLAAHIERQCLKRELAPADIVDPVLFLASQASAAMTGQSLVVDGGVAVTG
ncbi:3-oxoacyl-ACP reductase [Roseibium aquae]|uniref:3-oxoacyl-ACP reductase n=1 Tax=Roseibium aquae TaxID=1323746 RepID=A0A916WVM5_9HYPH|nr:SDR family oxidoreductase [Roseibium aquae]GGB33627.1 3-oxoacyl-ACP reductase [Roseibium aquae]